MKSQPNFENLNEIEKDIRRRLEKLDQERRVVEAELTDFLSKKQSIIELSKKYGGKEDLGFLDTEGAPAKPIHGGGSSELPWRRYASGTEKVVFVVAEAGARGLGRLEVVDRIEAISGERSPLNSVTTWLNRARKQGEVRNRKRRWYPVK